MKKYELGGNDTGSDRINTLRSRMALAGLVAAGAAVGLSLSFGNPGEAVGNTLAGAAAGAFLGGVAVALVSPAPDEYSERTRKREKLDKPTE